MRETDDGAVPVQLTTLESSAALSFSPSTSHYDVKTVASKAIVEGHAHPGLACNVSTNGAEYQHYSSCDGFISVSEIPDNVTVIIYTPTDVPVLKNTYYVSITSEPFSDETRVIAISAAGLCFMCDTAVSLVAFSRGYFAHRHHHRDHRCRRLCA
jgi:hypothetical protein